MKIKFADSFSIENSTDVRGNIGFSDPGFYTLVTYHIIAMILGLAGNSIVIYGSKKYNSLGLDTVSSALLEGLAILDLGIISTIMFQIAASWVGNRWVLGTAGCFLFGITAVVCFSSETTIVMLVSLHRLLTLIYPFRSRDIEPIHAKIVMGIVVVLKFVYTLGHHLFGSYYKFQGETVAFCEINPTSTSGINYLLTGIVINFIIPSVLIPASNIAILVIATIKSKGRALPSRQALFTISLVAWTFVLSVTPANTRVWLAFLAPTTPQPIWFEIMCLEFLFMNSILNPVIYTLTNRTFRRFLKKLVCGRTQTVGVSDSQIGQPKNKVSRAETSG